MDTWHGHIACTHGMDTWHGHMAPPCDSGRSRYDGFGYAFAYLRLSLQSFSGIRLGRSPQMAIRDFRVGWGGSAVPFPNRRVHRRSWQRHRHHQAGPTVLQRRAGVCQGHHLPDPPQDPLLLRPLALHRGVRVLRSARGIPDSFFRGCGSPP